ncbi:multifunctional protein ADE2-like [Sycon ciliatum]|uniref:multifunctional protein ADE2-like n=1 Tax=Sycon ciliatum TaxID=27933 RepID=UPI0031F63BD1
MEVLPGEKIAEGKTKEILTVKNPESLPAGDREYVLLQSKDRITANNAQRVNDMEGKGALATSTTVAIFELLNDCGVKTHFVQRHTDTSLVSVKCAMVPIEFVTRRVATGSFLKRNQGVKEGHRFAPPLLEYFFKDDEAGDPQWSYQQIVAAAMDCGGVVIKEHHLDEMSRMTVTVFEILERAWASLGCTLVDMKIEFGVNPVNGEILLADVIDNDSWRLWPSGDRRLQMDKQVYRDLREVTVEAMQEIRKNYAWVAEKASHLSSKPWGRVVIFMGSASDKDHCDKIAKVLRELKIPVTFHVCSAHKSTPMSLGVLHEIEAEAVPTVIIAVAGRSNGLGPVLAGNTVLPVINCPPMSSQWGEADVWSSLRMPSGLGCTTAIQPDTAALNAATILSLNDHMLWGRMRGRQLNTYVGLIHANQKINQ